MSATGYEPLNTLKPVGDRIWIIDGPHIRFFGMPFSTRATVVQLSSGEVWVHSPTKLADALAAEVAGLGPVRHLIAPNWIHYAYVADWQARFPEARSWAAPGVAERASKRGVPGRWDHTLTQGAPEAWDAEIDQMIVEGSKVHREAVFFHRLSRTLILTDLVENFEARHLSWPMRIATRLGGIQAPDGQMPRDMRLTFARNRDALKAQVDQMIAWAPERVILAHGAWFGRDGVAQLRRAFRWVL